MVDADSWLHLFTSNIRELYIRDAMSVAAAPDGLHYRFRYDEQYVADDLRLGWRGDKLAGREVAVYFSVQHPLNYHEAAYIPVRRGNVVRTRVEGNIYVIDFRLGGYLPLIDVPDDTRARPVRELSRALRESLGSAYPDNTGERFERSPDRRSAAPGPSPFDLRDPNGVQLIDQGLGSGRGFERLATYLAPCLMPPRPLFRMATVVNEAGEDVALNSDGQLVLTPEHGYRIEVIHYQHDPVDSQPSVALQVPESITVLSDTEIVFHSRYDIVELKVFVPARDDIVEGEIVLTMSEPGYEVRVPVRLEPTQSQVLLNPGIALLGGVLVAVPGLMGDGDTGLKIALAVGGAVALAFATVDRRRRGMPGS